MNRNYDLGGMLYNTIIISRIFGDYKGVLSVMTQAL